MTKNKKMEKLIIKVINECHKKWVKEGIVKKKIAN